MEQRTAPSEASFAARLDENKAILFKIAGSYSRSPAEREDLAQEIALQLWRSYPRFDESQRFSTWMYRVALNTAISHLRREATHRTKVATGVALPEVAAPNDAGSKEEMLDLRRLIEELDPLNRALILLYLDDNSYETIADVLGISTTNVATKINRIKTKMRARLAPQQSAGKEPHGTR